eukprot:gene2958-1940_t
MLASNHTQATHQVPTNNSITQITNGQSNTNKTHSTNSQAHNHTFKKPQPLLPKCRNLCGNPRNVTCLAQQVATAQSSYAEAKCNTCILIKKLNTTNNNNHNTSDSHSIQTNHNANGNLGHLATHKITARTIPTFNCKHRGIIAQQLSKTILTSINNYTNASYLRKRGRPQNAERKRI